MDADRLDKCMTERIRSDTTAGGSLARGFMFATGIEGSYPTVAGPNNERMRVDEMERCCHYKHWKQDFSLIVEIGCDTVRWGPPIHRTWLGDGKYDWDFTDLCMAEIDRLDLHPVVDLCHFGVPDWIGDFQNPDLPELFARYATDFAARFPWVQCYTPVNEIYIAARFSGLYGWWNERLTSHKGFVTALKHLCRANELAMDGITAVRPDAIFIQSESTEFFHAERPSSLDGAYFLNEQRFLPLDLTYAFPITAQMYEYLLDNGMSRDEYHWFQNHHVKAQCILGNDYYVTNEHLVNGDGTTNPSGEIFGYYIITRQYYDRYRLPVMHTETNIAEPHSEAWLKKEWANVYRLRQDGVPIVGFTWYSLTDQVDWDTALREPNGNVNALGLYNLDRQIRPVGKAYQELIRDWRPVLPNETVNLQMFRW